METKEKYIQIKSRQVANCIHYLSGLKYLIFDDKNDSSKKVYSFENTPEFNETFEKVNQLRNELRQLNS